MMELELLQSGIKMIAIPALFTGGMWEIIGNSSWFGILIILILIVMSLVSWGIMINKYRLFKAIDSQSRKFASIFSRANNLGDAMGQAKSYRLTPLTSVYAAGIKETDAVMEAKNAGGAIPEKKRKLEEDDLKSVTLMLDKTIAEEMGKLEKNVVFLATTANAAPFLGLLGTIVGVMEAFWSIGERGSASLAVVAPGIAEALLVIIFGLAAAIPAVIGYNWANNRLKQMFDDANNFGMEFMARLRKDTYQ